MKKIKISFSFFLLVLICVICQKFTLLINYILALLLHELAHLFVSLKLGYSLNSLRLSLFGVAVELNEKIEDKDAFLVNISGPIFNLFLSLICVAMYWLVPISYNILNIFCIANLTLAIFNLLPVYPLDGGKIFRSIFGIKKFKIIEKVFCFTISIIALIIFIFSCFNKVNLFFLLLAIFFATTKTNKENKMSLFKFSENKKIEKIELLKLTGQETLFELLKKIQTKKYTIFYYNQSAAKYIDEDEIIQLSTRYPLTKKLCEIIK